MRTQSTENGNAMIRLEGVSKWFGDFQALNSVDLGVDRQEVVVVCGPSGSGKSTMIRCINRLEKHERGRIVVDGIELSDDLRNIQEIRREVGMVFQQFNLFPHLTVLDNVMLAPRHVRHTAKNEAREAAMRSASFLPRPRTRRCAIVRFSVTVRCGKRLNCWNTMPIRRRTASMSTSGSVTSTPPTKICPDVGSSSRLMQRSSVDFPDPDRPMTHTTSPVSTRKSMPLSTSRSPKDL